MDKKEESSVFNFERYEFTSIHEIKKRKGHRKLGEGGFGEVHLDPGPPPVAIKFGSVPLREFKMGKLAEEVGVGPKIHYFKLGTEQSDKDDCLKGSMLVMEFLDDYEDIENFLCIWNGRNYRILKKKLDHLKVNHRKNVLKGVANIMRSLGKLHVKGIVHGDFHLGNCMIALDGQAKIIDYGSTKQGNMKHLPIDIDSDGWEDALEVLKYHISKESFGQLEEMSEKIKKVIFDRELTDKEIQHSIHDFYGNMDDVLKKEGL